MSSLEKHHTTKRGSSQSHRKCSDAFSDTSSVGSLMDDADREVSNLTDRAFRSLCIGDDAIYNDLEVSSPAERHTAFVQEPKKKKDLKTTCQDSHYWEDERKSEVASTFQHSCVDVAQEQFHREERLSYISNGSTDATWQQKRSSSRVSSLVKASTSEECYSGSGVPDAQHLKDKHKDLNESWDKSALLSIQRELSEFSSAYNQNFKPYGNNFHAALTRTDATSSVMKSPKAKFKVLNSTNFFFHSEFSPFQLWKDYNRFPLEREEFPGFVSTTDFPRWYDAPLYKELTNTHKLSASPSEARPFNQRQIEDVVVSQQPKPTIIQKASAIEKRCESEIASNCPPWRRNNNFVKNKLPSNRPSTVSPSNEKAHRPDSSLLYCSKHAYDIQHQVRKVSSSESSSTMTPFNITQLLTPVIHKRQETETSEILQVAHTPLVPNYSPQSEADLKSLSDVKQLRDSYKSKASSLLFNLKDNRKRVKSTYSPPKFKGSEIVDRNKQPSKLDDLSHTTESKVTNQKQSTGPDTWEHCNSGQKIYEAHLSQTVEHKKYANGSHDMTLDSQYGAAKSSVHYVRTQDKFINPDKLSNRENGEYGLVSHKISALGKIAESQTGPTRPEIENAISNPHLPAHLLTQLSEKQTFSNEKDAGNHKQQDVMEKTSAGYVNNQGVEERISWKNPGQVNITNKEMFKSNGIKEPFKGEIAALVEMDKQRKAFGKQHAASGSESYAMDKERYINKVNESIKQSRLAKQKEVLEAESASQNCPSPCFPSHHVKDYPSVSQHLHRYQNHIQKMASPPKETNGRRGSEIKSTTCENVEAHLQKDVNHAQRECRQKIQYLSPLEEKHQTNEGSVTYQPYKYNPNKQWHIGITESSHIKDEAGMSPQLQHPEQRVQQPDTVTYTNPITRSSYNHQQNTTHSTKTSQRARPEEPELNDSSGHSQIYQTKKQDIKTDISTEPNNSLQTKESRFNINDILSVRDNEQAKRVRENKQILTASLSDPVKLKGLEYIAEDKGSKINAAKVKHDEMPQEQISHHKPEKAGTMLPVYAKKEPHNNNGSGLKSGKDIFISKENDKVTPRAYSYKDKGQTKQDILTSKLKAHAQKEISAIKEKELAKQNILPRNPVNRITGVNSENGQVNQDVLPLRKEITAERLDHLFQDITYSSVTLHKDKDEPKYESRPTEKVKLSPKDRSSPATSAAADKNNQVLKDGQVTEMSQRTEFPEGRLKVTQKQNSEVPKVSKNDGNETLLQSTEYQPSRSKRDQKEQPMYSSALEHEAIPAKHMLRSPAQRNLSEEESVMKTDLTSSNLPTIYDANHTKYSPFFEMGNGTQKYDEKTANNISDQAKTLDHFVNKPKEQPSHESTDKLTFNKYSMKFGDIGETGLPTTQEATAAQEEEQHESRVGGGNGIDKQITCFSGMSPPKPCNKVYSKHTPENHKLEKQDNRTHTGSTAKSNDSPQLQHSDNSQLMAIKNASKESGQQTLNPNKSERTKPGSSAESKQFLAMHSGKDEDQQKGDESMKIKDLNNQDIPVTAEAKTKGNIQQLQQCSDNQTQMANDKQEQTGKKATENKQSNDDCIKTNTSNNVSTSTGTENEKSETTSCPPNIPPVPDESADKIKPEPESCIIHIASKDDITSTDEPVIYNICVSSKSDAVDEPIIFSICVSSISDASMTDDSVNHNTYSTGQKQCSTEQVKTDEETFDSKNEKTERDSPGSKADYKKESKVLETEHEQESKSPASKAKPDYYTSTQVDNLALSYERLLVKYGLAHKDEVNLETEQIERANEKEESARSLSQNMQKNTMDDDRASSEKELVSHGFTRKHSQESRKPKSPEKPPEPIKEAEETREHCVTHPVDDCHMMNGHVGLMGNKNIEGKEQHAENRTQINVQDNPASKKIPKVVPICDESLDTKATVVLKQIMTSGNVQVKENKKVRHEGETSQKEPKENDNEKVVSKNAQTEQVKCKVDKQYAAGIKSTGKSSCLHDDSQSSSSNISVKVCKDHEAIVQSSEAEAADMPLVENSQIALHQSVTIINDRKLQNRTQEECERNADKPSKESALTKDDQTSQNNTKELVCKEEFSEQEQALFMTRTAIKGSMGTVSQIGVSTFTNKNSGVTEDHIKKEDQSLIPVSDIRLEDNQMPKNDALAVQDNQILHHEQIKTTNAKVREHKSPSALTSTADELKPENKHRMHEPEEKHRESVKSGITTGTMDNSMTASSLSKETTMHEYLNEKTAQPHERKHTTEKATEKTGQRAPEVSDMTAKNSSKTIRMDMISNGEALEDMGGNHLNVYQLQSQDGFITERKRNTYEKGSSVGSSQYSQHHNTEVKMKTEQGKKTSKPEISALADYARLRVIAAEDDSTSEKDLLQKMNTHHKYKLSAVGPHKGSQEGLPTIVSGTEKNIEVASFKKYDHHNPAKPLIAQERESNLFQRNKITDGQITDGHIQYPTMAQINAHPKSGSLPKNTDEIAVKDTSTKDAALTNQMQSNTKTCLAEHCGYQQAEGKNDTLPKLKQPVHAKMRQKQVYPHENNAQSLPESLTQNTADNRLNQANKQAPLSPEMNVVSPEMNPEETTDELQYYIVNAMESEPKPKDLHEPYPLSPTTNSNKQVSDNSATIPRSNTTSPAVGKPTMFRVKDNTNRSSSVIKTVRPRFHRSLSEEFRIGSPKKEIWCGSEKVQVEEELEHDTKESTDTPALHEPSVRFPKAKEIQSRNILFSSEFIGAKERSSYPRKNQLLGEDETQAVISKISDDVVGLGASTASHAFKARNNRGSDARPESELVCYERPESACYERPESVCSERPDSVCSDIRPLSKPPVVPPKTEKALRRAKKLTSRRTKKAETKMAPNAQGQLESKSIRAVCSLPASPMELMATHQAAHASPPVAHYHVEPNYAPPVPNIMTHSFPMTQRKLLQDPNSGQYFMVDMPVQVKTKTFFDPQTGKYLQLNVREGAQSTLSQPASVEVLGHPCVMYPGFLPMSVSVSSVPSLRSSSHMSTSATLTEGQQKLERSQESSEPETYQPEHHRNIQQCNKPGYETHEQPSHSDNNVNLTPKRTHIITMSELEDFAVENL